MKNKILLTFMFGIFLISFASASIQTLGTFKQSSDIQLIQICADCNTNNITSIINPDSQQIISFKQMDKNGSYYNFTLNSTYTGSIGNYVVNGIGDPSGTAEIWSYDFKVTPTGRNINNSFYFIIIGISLAIMVLGFWLRDAPLTIFSTFGLYFVGLYILFNGIVGVKDMVTTWSIGIILLAIAGYISIKSATELMN